jgi:hypothetical protein
MKAIDYYEKNKTKRQPYLDRAKQFAKVTMPSIMREDGDNESSEMPRNYVQSLGADCVNTLVSKMGLTLFPPSASSFRLVHDIQNLDEQSAEDVNRLLSAATNKINKEIEKQNMRTYCMSALEQLIIVGCCIQEKIPNDGIKIHSLRNFVATINDRGFCKEFCILEKTDEPPVPVEKEEDSYDLYTYAKLNKETSRWEMFQEFDGNPISGSEKSFKEEDFPFEYIGFKWSDNEKYHRPYVEDYYGSLNSYDKINKVLTQGAIMSSKIIYFTNEAGGRTSIADVAGAENGAVIKGSAEDVTVLETKKNYDFQIPYQYRNELKDELQEAFLSKNSITRQAERVTAEEIRQMAQDLESKLTGLYSVVSVKIIKRYIKWILSELKLDLKSIEASLITGLNALGLSAEAVKLDNFMQRMFSLQMINYINPTTVISRYAEGFGIDINDLVKTAEQIQQEQQQAMLAQASQQMLDSAAQSGGEQAVQNMQGAA